MTTTELDGALAGAVGAGVALATGELLAGLAGGVPSPVVAVGQLVIDTAPGAVERAAIDALGTADKPALVVGTVVVALLVGAGLGLASRRTLLPAVIGFALFGVLGAVAGARVGGSSGPSTAVALAVAVAAGIASLHLLTSRLPTHRTGGDTPARAGPGAGAGDRRSFFRLAGVVSAGAAAAAVVGRQLELRANVTASRAAVRLPPPATPVPIPAAADLGVGGVAPFVTPNAEFYRIDTALRAPQVDPATWRLAVRGLVDRPFELSYDELLGLADREAAITLACVSNEVGDDLVGNAVWQGVLLADLLERAGVQRRGTQVVGRSVDGFTAGFPTELALDGREALVAVAMNGEPLPVDHGFPARLVVPGLYGYVSATKWLERIELVPWEGFDGYWIPRGWSKEGPVKTQSRIDVPRPGATVRAGTVAVGGVAWAPHRGVRAVEVRVDDGDWAAAGLGAGVGDDTWRQWVWRWDATPGRHTLSVRATDGDGEVQTAEPAGVLPDGATGHHTIAVTVG